MEIMNKNKLTDKEFKNIIINEYYKESKEDITNKNIKTNRKLIITLAYVLLLIITNVCTIYITHYVSYNNFHKPMSYNESVLSDDQIKYLYEECDSFESTPFFSYNFDRELVLYLFKGYEDNDYKYFFLLKKRFADKNVQNLEYQIKINTETYTELNTLSLFEVKDKNSDKESYMIILYDKDGELNRIELFI